MVFGGRNEQKEEEEKTDLSDEDLPIISTIRPTQPTKDVISIDNKTEKLILTHIKDTKDKCEENQQKVKEPLSEIFS